MTRCPYCPFEARDTPEEVAHMQAEHPEVVERRMRDAGFVRDENAELVDKLIEEP